MIKEVFLLPLFAASIFSGPVPEKVKEALPYIQVTAASAVLLNNGWQVAKHWASKEP